MEPPNNPQFPQCSNGDHFGEFHFLDPFGGLGFRSWPQSVTQTAHLWCEFRQQGRREDAGGFPQLGVHFWGCNTKDHNILGFILGSPYLGKLSMGKTYCSRCAGFKRPADKAKGEDDPSSCCCYRIVGAMPPQVWMFPKMRVPFKRKYRGYLGVLSGYVGFGLWGFLKLGILLGFP